jgi:ParB family transcriptional regulator, chromosome partitioning protein
MIENVAREPLNPVDQWRAIDRLTSIGWTDEAISSALTLPPRHIRKLRLLAQLLPAMLDHIAKGDMPSEHHLRTIVAASLEEQAAVWKKLRPTKAQPTASWHQVAHALQKTRMYARDARFGEDLAKAYGIAWVEDLFAPADEDGRYTVDVEGFLGAQQEWMASNLPKGAKIAETNQHGEVVLPAKAERIYSTPGKGDQPAVYLDKSGKVQTVYYRLPVPKAKGNGKGKGGDQPGAGPVDSSNMGSTPRPDVTRVGLSMIGDFRTEALHDALSRGPIEDDTLMALLVLALAGNNVTIKSGSSEHEYGFAPMKTHVRQLINTDGRLECDRDSLRLAARSALIITLSARDNSTNSGIVARVAGQAVGADAYLPNMGTEEFLSCLSRRALEEACRGTPVLPRSKVKETRAALVEHCKTTNFVHGKARFSPDPEEIQSWRDTGWCSLRQDDDGAAGGHDVKPTASPQIFAVAAE